MPFTHLPTKSAGEVLTLSNYNSIKNNFATGVPDIFTAKGDLAVGTAADAATRLAVGENDSTLVADSSQTTGLAWQIKPAARVYNSGNILTAVSGWESLTFNSERFDTDGMHSLSENTGRLTAPAGGAGLYLIGGTVKFQVAAIMSDLVTYVAYMGIRILYNGLSSIAVAGDSFFVRATSEISGAFDILTLYNLNVGDYVELQRMSHSKYPYGALVAANYSPEFWAIWRRRA